MTDQCEVCGKVAELAPVMVCSECLATAPCFSNRPKNKQVIHMSIGKHKELMDKLATLQKEQHLRMELGVKYDVASEAIKAVHAAWTEGADFNMAKKRLFEAFRLISSDA